MNVLMFLGRHPDERAAQVREVGRRDGSNDARLRSPPAWQRLLERLLAALAEREGAHPLVGSPAFLDQRFPVMQNVGIATIDVVIFGTAIVQVILFSLFVTRTVLGISMRASAENLLAAQLVGIPTARVVGYGFGLGLATAAIGGTALALDSTIYPSLHWQWIGPLMAIIVVGGLGSVPGTAIAAMVLGLAMSLLQIPLGTTWAQTVFYLALFATLAFRPQGFFGGRLAKRF